jgi:hypothetical protein
LAHDEHCLVLGDCTEQGALLACSLKVTQHRKESDWWWGCTPPRATNRSGGTALHRSENGAVVGLLTHDTTGEHCIGAGVLPL